MIPNAAEVFLLLRYILYLHFSFTLRCLLSSRLKWRDPPIAPKVFYETMLESHTANKAACFL